MVVQELKTLSEDLAYMANKLQAIEALPHGYYKMRQQACQ